MMKEFPRQDQRLAVGYGAWKHHQQYKVTRDPTAPKPIQMPVPERDGPRGKHKYQDDMGAGYQMDAGEGLSESGSP